MTRLAVPKTYKLYIGGKFPRSESGRTYEIETTKGDFVANVAKASRKDARDAIVAARAALKGWAGATAYNRGQVLYRIAELLEGRRAQFLDEITRLEGVSAAAASAQVDEAIDRWVWYAGWTDKHAQVTGNANPVAGPYFNISVPEPTGVVAVIAPQDSSLLGFVSAVAPPLVTGNTVVVVASERLPLSAISLAEVLATSDVPGGVVNILTGSPAEMARLARGRERARPGRRRKPRLDRPADRRRRHAQARAAARGGPGCRGSESRPDQRVHRDQDGLAHQEHGLNLTPEHCAEFR
jgi:acyl-CoA reductase-like NAD-dependent aldehyde dehydrogenase